MYIMLNNRIKEIRKQANMTQEKLAKLTDVRRETIIRLEKNLYNPSLELAFKIARVLDCDINVIFQYTGDITIDEPQQIGTVKYSTRGNERNISKTI